MLNGQRAIVEGSNSIVRFVSVINTEGVKGNVNNGFSYIKEISTSVHLVQLTGQVIMIMWTFFMLGVSVVSSYTQASSAHCLWHNDTCVDKCPEWMIQRKSNCSESYWSAQRTCDHPEQMLVGTVCGFSRCDCPDSLVLDTETGICYDVDNCPTIHAIE